MTRGLLVVAAVASLAGCWSTPGGLVSYPNPESIGELPPEVAYDARKLGTDIEWIADPELAERAARTLDRAQLVLHLSKKFTTFKST